MFLKPDVLKVSMGCDEEQGDGLGTECIARPCGHAHKALILSDVTYKCGQHVFWVFLLHQEDFGPQPSHLT